ncbi:hypothetical protein F7725_028923 [Dissostichus mawsoni]|uniref:Zinc transporter ZIP4 N-terminal domain-containing protein n=1 Tax=Dissostichus mawsoni TaxID=36200 RepID=A0A7J5XH19_DISMA|nr:hypothetical protein F7725_028923 [Dissostichus mawsoni]
MVEAGWLKRRREVVACLVVFLHYDLPVKHPSPLPQHLHSMGSGRTLKFALCEVLQFAGLCMPLFIVMQRFAVIVAKVKTSTQPPRDGSTAYWLIVASSIAYVTSTALLVWVPMKYMVFVKKKFLIGRKKWRPVALVYVILSTLPCFAFLIASSEVQINNNMTYDTFTELPVSLVLFSLICIDVVERIRHCRLTGHGAWRQQMDVNLSIKLNFCGSVPEVVVTEEICFSLYYVYFLSPANDMERDADIPSTVLTHVEQVTPVSPITPAVPGPAVPGPAVPGPAVPGQAGQNPMQPGSGQRNDRNQNGPGARSEANGTLPGMQGNPGRPFSISGLSSRSANTSAYHISPYEYTGPLRFLCASDARADVFVDSFMFWMDTVEMVRVAGHPLVYYSGWVFPIYIFSYLSCLRVVVMPHSPLLPSLGVALQDFPFFFVRIGLISFFGFVTPILYLMKNLLVCLAFVYFNFMTKLRVFNTETILLTSHFLPSCLPLLKKICGNCCCLINPGEDNRFLSSRETESILQLINQHYDPSHQDHSDLQCIDAAGLVVGIHEDAEVSSVPKLSAAIISHVLQGHCFRHWNLPSPAFFTDYIFQSLNRTSNLQMIGEFKSTISRSCCISWELDRKQGRTPTTGRGGCNHETGEISKDWAQVCFSANLLVDIFALDPHLPISKGHFR